MGRGVGGLGKCLGEVWESVLRRGKVRGDGKSEGGVEKCWVRRGKVCWDVRKVREGTGCGQVLSRDVGKCVSIWERETGVWGSLGRDVRKSVGVWGK